jgi:hypothetical protein
MSNAPKLPTQPDRAQISTSEMLIRTQRVWMRPFCCVLHRPRAGAGQDLHDATVQPERRDGAVSGTWCVPQSSRSGRMPSGVALGRSPPGGEIAAPAGVKGCRRDPSASPGAAPVASPEAAPAASPEGAPAASRSHPITTRDTPAHRGRATPCPPQPPAAIRTDDRHRRARTATSADRNGPPRPRRGQGCRRAGAAWARGSRCNTPPPNKAGESSLKLIEAARKITTSDGNLWFHGAGSGRRPRW